MEEAPLGVISWVNTSSVFAAKHCVEVIGRIGGVTSMLREHMSCRVLSGGASIRKGPSNNILRQPERHGSG
jgi:hypothetical protein